MVIAHHLMFCAYGFWLPNVPSGAWSDFVVAAFGLRDREEALREHYLGAVLDGRTFRVWFHWPIARDTVALFMVKSTVPPLVKNVSNAANCSSGTTFVAMTSFVFCSSVSVSGVVVVCAFTATDCWRVS